MKSNKKISFLISFIILIAVVFKIYLLALDVIPFNSDEAVVGLMAKHILDGEYPIFFYGQSYMGSLDAFLIAGMFKIIGEKVIAIRIVQIILYSLIPDLYLHNRQTCFFAQHLRVSSPYYF